MWCQFAVLFLLGGSLPPASLPMEAPALMQAPMPAEAPVVVGGPVAIEAVETPVAPEVVLGAAEPRRPVVIVADPEVEDEAASAHPVIVVEPPRAFSFEGLRRGSYLYPDHDLGSRWVEMGTELPPLFGEESF